MKNDAAALTELFATLSLGAPENAIGFVLWRLAHRFQREADRVLASTDLTHLQFTTLTMAGWLGQSGKLVPQAEIARFCGMHPMQVSLMLKALEAKGLIARERDTAHVRAKRVAITPAGAATLRRALPEMIELQHRLFGEEGRPERRVLGDLLKLEKGAATTPSGLGVNGGRRTSRAGRVETF